MIGLMPAPPGVVPDFYRTTQVQISFIAVFAVTFTLATIALLMRVYTRAFIVKSVGLDERAYHPPPPPRFTLVPNSQALVLY
jgi:hypothetical protein